MCKEKDLQGKRSARMCLCEEQGKGRKAKESKEKDMQGKVYARKQNIYLFFGWEI